MRHLSERHSELNQKQTTYRRGRECPFLFTPSFDWFCHYVAKCPDGSALTWINGKNFGRLGKRQFIQVARQTDRQMKQRKKREVGEGRGEKEKKYYSASKRQTWSLIPPHSTENCFFFCFVLFQNLMCSQVEFQPQWIVQQPLTSLLMLSGVFLWKGQESYWRSWNINIINS